MNFHYYVQSENGRFLFGNLRAKSEEHARSALSERFKKIYSIEYAKPWSAQRLLGARISREEKLLFIKNLHVIIKSSVPIAEALQILHEQSETRGTQTITRHLVKQIQAGNNLASALGHYGHVFDPFIINMIYVGESSGTLDKSLGYLANQLEHDLELFRKVRAASLYPIILLVAILGLGVIMMQFILPKLLRVFNSIGADLPPITNFLLAFIRFMSENGTTITVTAVTLFIAFRLLLHIPHIRLAWLQLFLHTPLIGKMVKNYNIAVFTRTIGSLLASGTPLIDALGIAAQATHNLYYKIEILKTQDRVTQGHSLSDALRDHKHFSIITSRLVGVGEKSGTLDSNLAYLSDFYSNKIDYATKNLTTLIEPILLLIVGLVVGFVAVALISPIYDFTASIGR